MRTLCLAVIFTAILYAVFYGGWLVLAGLEERPGPPPFWDGQFRSFIPGDLFLWAAMGTSIALYAENELSRYAWLLPVGGTLGLAVAAVLFWSQFSEAEKAHPDAMWIWIAPTRVWHQLFTWGIGITLFAAFVVPVLVAYAGGQVRSAGPLLVLLFLAAYASCMVYDATHWAEPIPDRPIHAPLKERFRADWLTRFVSFLYPYRS